MSYKSRVNTMIMIINRMDAIADRRDDIRCELKNIISLTKSKAIKKRELYVLLFSSRSIDTFLKTYLDHYNLSENAYSIGQYIDILSKSNDKIKNITLQQKKHYKKYIANIRNKYLHSANSYPAGKQEVSELISEIHSLITVVEGLTNV